MIILIFSLNLFRLLIWWDILGLLSFLLVIFYKNIKIINYRIIVIFLNRLSDFFLLVRLSLIINNFNINLSFNLEFEIRIFFLMSLILKRSQYPFNL